MRRLSDFAGVALFACFLLLAGAMVVGYVDVTYRLERVESTRRGDAEDTKELRTRLQGAEASLMYTRNTAESLRTWIRAISDEVDERCKPKKK